MEQTEMEFDITEPTTQSVERSVINFTKMVEDKTKAAMRQDKALCGVWSMREIVDTLTYDMGPMAGEVAKTYILRTRLGLSDKVMETNYIDRAIQEARFKEKTDKFFKGKAIKASNNTNPTKETKV